MKLVLIGASGFLGRYLAQALSVDGHQCLVLSRQVVRRRDLKLIPGVRIAQADVYSPGALADCLGGADAVVSMAGILNERGFDGSGFRRVHVELVEGLLEACRSTGVKRLLHVSALNAGKGASHYLQSKGEAEKILLDSGLAVTVFQPSVIFGPGDSFFNRFASFLKISPVLPLACPAAKMQPVFVKDVAQAMAVSLADESTHGQVYELGGPQVWTLQELVQWTAGALGLKRWIAGLPDPLSRLQGKVMGLVPGKPFSSDNYKSLQIDNIASANALPQFGINPASVDAIVPGYLGVSQRQQRLVEIRRKLGAE